MKSPKATQTRRGYDDACAATHAIGLIGERWALPVMRELMLGPRRFGDLKASIAGISAKLLSQRLEELEAAGIVRRTRLPPPASVAAYELTPWGREAGPIFQAMGRWAVKSPGHDPSRPFSPVSLMLSFRTMIDPERARDVDGTILFRIGGEAFTLRLAGGAAEPARGEPASADLVLAGTAQAIAAAIYGGVPFAELEAQGALEIDGDRALAHRFATLFPLPEKEGD